MTTRTKRLLVLAVGALAIVVALRLLLTPARKPGPSAAGGPAAPAAAQLRQFGITFGTVERRALAAELRATGVIVPDETRLAEVTPRVGGVVERLHVAATGARVTRGAPLLELYAPEVMAAEEELLIAARLDREVGPAPTSLVASARRRLELWGVPGSEIDAVLRDGHARRTFTIVSPISGVVLEKPVQRGQSVTAGQTLYRLADLSRVWVEIEAREADAATLRPGAAVEVELAAYPGRPLAGRVDYVYPVLDTTARTVRARVALPSADGRLKPGMYATVRLASAGRQALTVPTSAVVRTGERDLVFVDQKGGRLAPMDVVPGQSAGDYTEILRGLEPGQRVVTSAQYLLESESNLSEVMRGMISQTGSGEMGGHGAPDTLGKQDMPGMDMPGMDMKGADLRDKAGGHR